jgi:hypothetical protein
LDYRVNWIGELEGRRYGRQIEKKQTGRRKREVKEKRRKEATRLRRS